MADGRILHDRVHLTNYWQLPLGQVATHLSWITVEKFKNFKVRILDCYDGVFDDDMHRPKRHVQEFAQPNFDIALGHYWFLKLQEDDILW